MEGCWGKSEEELRGLEEFGDEDYEWIEEV